MKKPLGFSFLAALSIAFFCFQSVRRQIIERGRIRLPSLEDRTSYMLFSNMLLAIETGALYVDFKGKLELSFYYYLRVNVCVFPLSPNYSGIPSIRMLFLRLLFCFSFCWFSIFSQWKPICSCTSTNFFSISEFWSPVFMRSWTSAWVNPFLDPCLFCMPYYRKLTLHEINANC